MEAACAICRADNSICPDPTFRPSTEGATDDWRCPKCEHGILSDAEYPVVVVLTEPRLVTVPFTSCPKSKITSRLARRCGGSNCQQPGHKTLTFTTLLLPDAQIEADHHAAADRLIAKYGDKYAVPSAEWSRLQRELQDTWAWQQRVRQEFVVTRLTCSACGWVDTKPECSCGFVFGPGDHVTAHCTGCHGTFQTDDGFIDHSCDPSVTLSGGESAGQRAVILPLRTRTTGRRNGNGSEAPTATEKVCRKGHSRPAKQPRCQRCVADKMKRYRERQAKAKQQTLRDALGQ